MKTAARRVLFSVLAFMALQAIGGGAYGLAGAEGVPVEWLAGSPFRDYVVPSVILIVVVGGSLSIAAMAVFAQWRRAPMLAALAGVIMLGWIATQVAIIGYVSWMQPAVALVSVVIVALALVPKGSRA